MKNRIVNLDRPPLDSSEIQAGMNFGQLMVAYKGMSKPFYKTKWFFGTTGLASIGLITGSVVLFSDGADQEPLLTDSEPVMELQKVPESEPHENLIALNTVYTQDEVESKEEDKKETIKLKKNDKTDTRVIIDKATENNELSNLQENYSESINTEQIGTFNIIDLSPRINGKLDGNITREELLDNKGLTTNTDVSIIHFELHLIDGLGGKVFEEESNQINTEMKEALKNVDKGETIYFENIKGKTQEGQVVKLNPLRYILLN